MAVIPVQPVATGLEMSSSLVAVTPQGATSFADVLLQGVKRVDRELADADRLAATFAIDDSIPIHQVTYALEHARLQFELMLQVRARLVEGYQELMRMQL